MPSLELAVESVTLATTVVHVAGELDWASVEPLRECVRSIDPGSTTVILDVRGLTFLDSMGIGALALLHQELDQAARTLQVRNLGGQPSRVIEMTGLHKLLHLI